MIISNYTLNGEVLLAQLSGSFSSFSSIISKERCRGRQGGRVGPGSSSALTPGWPLQLLPSSSLQWGPWLCSVSTSNHEGGFRHLPFLLLSGLYTPSWAGRVEGEGSGASGMDRSRTCHPGGVSSLGPSTSTHPRGCIMEIITLPHRDAVRTETTYETRLAQKRSQCVSALPPRFPSATCPCP